MRLVLPGTPELVEESSPSGFRAATEADPSVRGLNCRNVPRLDAKVHVPHPFLSSALLADLIERNGRLGERNQTAFPTSVLVITTLQPPPNFRLRRPMM